MPPAVRQAPLLITELTRTPRARERRHRLVTANNEHYTHQSRASHARRIEFARVVADLGSLELLSHHDEILPNDRISQRANDRPHDYLTHARRTRNDDDCDDRIHARVRADARVQERATRECAIARIQDAPRCPRA